MKIRITPKKQLFYVVNFLSALLLLAIPHATGADEAPAKLYQEDFEKADALPEGWEKQADVTVTGNEKFQGSHALQIARTEDKFDVATSAISPVVKLAAGPVEVDGAFKAALHSPDSSFNATITLRCMDAAGKSLEDVRVADYHGTVNWVQIKKQVQAPAGTVAARLRIEFNKTDGKFWADNLAIVPVAAAEAVKSNIHRILFKTSAPGNLFMPGDKPVFNIVVETVDPLAKDGITAVVRDYWGAEQTAPVTAKLEDAGTVKEIPAPGPVKPNPAPLQEFGSYKATIDFSGAQFETGKYYEIHVAFDDGTGNLFRETKGFAFLPEAVTKKYPWRDIPFSSRNWDNRIPDYFTLSDRLGIRLLGVWGGGWSSASTYKPTAPGLDLVAKLDAGALCRTPIPDIEHHLGNYKAIDETVLRNWVRNYLREFGKDKRIMFTLGNEPPQTGETVAANVAAYKAVYEEVKKISPDTFVVSTSVGPSEEYFKLGFQNYCDAVDYHTYEDANGVAGTFKKYAALFEKYGGKKPIWSTESGLNSQGLTRRAIATDLIKKFSLFFANGGENISWFTIGYPDRQGKLRGGADDSFNVFDGLYGLYGPRLDAIAYYNMVNAICVKKFVAGKEYENGVESYMYRDKDAHILQVLWKKRGEEDVFVPLKDIGSVKMIRIDGVITTMDAAKQGLTLRVGIDPIILLYDGDQSSLPDKLEAPRVSFASLPEKITRGESLTLNLSLKGVTSDQLQMKVPPFWKAGKIKMDGDSAATVEIEPSSDTEARYAPISVSIKGKNGDGDLTAFIPVQGQLSAQLMPAAATAPGDSPSVELRLHNNNSKPETVNWKLALPQEVPLRAGRYTMEFTRPAQAYFGDTAEGRKEVAAHGDAVIRVPLSGVDPLTSYKVAATVTDAVGRVVNTQRFIGGFVGVPKVSAPLKMDGTLTSPEWARCVPQKIDKDEQYRHLSKNIHTSWAGPKDLSADVRFLWDDKYLYVGVKVTDNVFQNNASGTHLWSGDGIQLLVDPARSLAEKPGKYDYSFALTKNGPQAWCFLSADGRAPAGEAKDVIVSTKRLDDKTGDMSYEIAIPWNRLQPFKPGAGANLGLAMAINEDDGPGRDGFMAWFGDIQMKEVSPVADLILGD